jgi:hypothetical protein
MTQHNDEIDFEVEVVRRGLPQSMKLKRACKEIQCGPTFCRELIADEKIDGRKMGRDIVVRTASILRYQANLPKAQFAKKHEANTAAS